MTTTLATTTTTFTPHKELETWEIIVLVTALGIILIGSVIGNIMVCLCIYLKKEMRSVVAMFIANLAIADLGTGVFCLPMAIASVLDVSILKNEATCNLNAFCLVLFFTTSINTMAVTSVYKYWTVGFAMKSKQVKRKHALFAIIVIWLISIALAVGPVIGWNKYHYLNDRFQCSPKAPQGINEYSYLLALLLFGYAIPVPLMIFCYARVYFISKHHFRRMRQNSVSDMSLLKSEAHLITTLWIVLIAFIICWLPFLIYIIAGILNRFIPFHLPILAFTFGYSNSILNPLVYVLRVKSFRHGFKEIISGHLKKKHSVPAYLTYKGDKDFSSNNKKNKTSKSFSQAKRKKASLVYVLSGSNNKAFMLEEGEEATKKISSYKISQTNTYPMFANSRTPSRDESHPDIEDGSSVFQDKQRYCNIKETVAVIDQSRKKSTTSRRSAREAALPRLYPHLSCEESNDSKEVQTDSYDCIDGNIEGNINHAIQNDETCEQGNAQYNGEIEMDARAVKMNFDRQIEVVLLTETRTENFTKVVNLCQYFEERSPQGEYQITRQIIACYHIHVIINPTENEINEFGKPCIHRVLRTLTWEDVYFDSLGNKVMTKKEEVAKSEDVNVKELPSYMREHIRLERQLIIDYV